MDVIRACVPITADGDVCSRLAHAAVVATCVLSGDGITEWTEHAVGWDTTYGVTVRGLHHASVIRFLDSQGVTLVVADEVCDSVRNAMKLRGITLIDHATGDPRLAVAAALVP